MSGVHFDENGIEVRWISIGENGKKYGVKIAVTDEFTGHIAYQHIEDIEVLKELIKVLEQLRDS